VAVFMDHGKTSLSVRSEVAESIWCGANRAGGKDYSKLLKI